MNRKAIFLVFNIRRNKLLRNGEAPLFMRITVDNERIESSLSRSINPNLWDDNRKRAKGNSVEAIQLNSYIDTCRNKVYEYQLYLERNNKPVTAKVLMNLFMYGIEKKRVSFLQFCQDEIAKMEKLVGIDMSASTIQRYNITLKLFKLFLETQGKTELYIDEIDSQTIPDFIFFLKAERKCQHNTVVKYIRGMAKIIRNGIKAGLIEEREERLNLSINAVETIPIFLTKEELNSIIEKDFDIERINQVKDIFLFCCYTGLAFIDVKGLKKEHLEKDNDGNMWIRKKRTKTGVGAHIPLLGAALKIIDKYSHLNSDFLFPVPSNQKMNCYLKEISDICGVKKTLTTHCARHTFATTVTLANKVSMESVSKMLGHTDIRMTKHYAQILDSTVQEEMLNLKNIWK
jgi:integrase